jgi:undecaprenyl-diphosphatase
MHPIEAIIMGVVEGLTEFLPVSSTGHLILTADILGLPDSEFLKSFEVVIQLGAMLSVAVLYWRRLLSDRQLMGRILVALLPALGVGFLFYPVIRTLLASELTVVVSLFIGGVVLIAYEWWVPKPVAPADLGTLSNKQALFIGTCQALSVIPGVSRAGATILGGLYAGLSRRAVVEFSFLLGAPTIFAASTLDIIKNPALFSGGSIAPLLIGFLTAFVVALLAMRFLLFYVETHSFVLFGAYRMLAAVLFFFLMI